MGAAPREGEKVDKKKKNKVAILLGYMLSLSSVDFSYFLRTTPTLLLPLSTFFILILKSYHVPLNVASPRLADRALFNDELFM